jgi:6-phosphogluconolactonase (cycloisomerase 2 family)
MRKSILRRRQCVKSLIRLLGVLAPLAAAVIGGSSIPVLASEGDDGTGHALFVQTNNPSGNAIAAYHRNSDGTLAYQASYSTGGLGGREAGAAADPLASQGSLVLARDAGLLLAVNAGSNTVSVFQASGDRLRLNQVIWSGGGFPTGIAVHENLVYVMDAGGQGFVSGYAIKGGRLQAIANSTRSLGLGGANPPFFLGAPAEVGFTPDGAHLVVTTKTHNTVDVFTVGDEGRLSAQPVSNAVSGVPFAFLFDRAGRLVLNYAGSSSLQTFVIAGNGAITPAGAAVSDGQPALCWEIAAHGFVYGGNAGGNDISQFRVNPNGSITLVNAIAASGIPGAIDMAQAGGRFLYAESEVSSSVHAFSIGSDGSLTAIQTVTVPDGSSLEGIAAA